jgi:hypothetical protein
MLVVPKSSCNNKPDFAAKKILLLTDRVQELMLELQSIKSSTCGDDKSIRFFSENKYILNIN